MYLWRIPNFSEGTPCRDKERFFILFSLHLSERYDLTVLNNGLYSPREHEKLLNIYLTIKGARQDTILH